MIRNSQSGSKLVRIHTITMISIIHGLFFLVGFLDMIGCVSAWTLSGMTRFRVVYITIFLCSIIYTGTIGTILYMDPTILFNFSYDGVAKMLEHPLLPISAVAHFATGDILISTLAEIMIPKMKVKWMSIGFKLIVGTLMFIWNPIALVFILPMLITGIVQFSMLNSTFSSLGLNDNNTDNKNIIPKNPVEQILDNDELKTIAKMIETNPAFIQFRNQIEQTITQMTQPESQSGPQPISRKSRKSESQ